MFRRARRAAAPVTLPDARFTGAWVEQGEAVGSITTGTTEADFVRIMAGGPITQGDLAPHVILQPLPGLARPMRGGAAQFVKHGYMQEGDVQNLTGWHSAIVNHPRVILGPVQMLPFDPTPMTVYAERPVTDAQNAPDVCGRV